MSKKLVLNFVIIFILTLSINLIFRTTIQDLQGYMSVSKYVLIGVGCGVFVGVLSSVIDQRRRNNNPAYKEKMQIEEKDERNIQIINAVKARVFDLLGIILGPIFVLISFTSTNFYTILVLIFFSLVCGIYYLVVYQKLNKEM